MMKRNGLVFVPPESPKRLILYPTQDSTQQQIGTQQPMSLNGFQSRIRTAHINNQQNDAAALPLPPPPSSSSNSNNMQRFYRPNPNSIPPKSSDKSNQDDGSNTASTNPSQRMANPYYANPFFRPKIVTNQSGATANPPPAPTVNRETSVITTTVPLQQPPSTTNSMTNGTRPSIYPSKPTGPISLANGKFIESETTFVTTSSQEEPRRWAHSVVPPSIAQRVLNDERPNGTVHSSTTNITNSNNGETAMHKHASATDIVISLMDPLRPPLNSANSSGINFLARTAAMREGGTLPESNTAPATADGTTSNGAAPSNNQNWRKTLLANFQKNSRNIPTAKIFQTKPVASQAPVLPPPPPPTNDPVATQPAKPERSMILNMNSSERTFQASDTTPPVPFFMKKSTESLRVTKQETNNTPNSCSSPTIERSTSLQVPSSAVSNGLTMTTTTITSIGPNSTETNKTKETTNSTESTTTVHPSISIPSALITAKPSVNVEQQRAIITRVMIRRDFVKSAESKPAMPPSGNPRLLIPPQAGRPNGLPNNGMNSMNSNPDNRNPSPTMSNTNRMYQPAQNQTHLSQKSLLQFHPTHPMARESIKIDPSYSNLHLQQQQHPQQQMQQSQQQQQQQQPPQPQPQMNENIIRERVTSASSARVLLTQPGSANPAGFRSTSLSATNAEAKRKKEELFNKAKKRAASASAVPSDGNMEKDPFEMEDEEYEAELEEESVRSSESDVENDTGVSLDPAVLLSEKARRVGNAEVKPGFIPSLFANVPPTIRFCTENQRIEQLPLPLRKMMKWKMSTITPNIVKNTVIRSGFRLISGDEGNDWLGTWSRHMKPICFKAIREYQKVNHFPGSFQIGRKDRLWRNLSHMQAVHSRREFDFVPQTFVLPADFLLFKRVFDEITDTKESKWIIKPPASARGQGIRVISKMEHVPKKRPVIVQKYIANPYLINGHKFDLRLYVYVTSHDPLRIYLFDDGLTRFASRKYSSSVKSLSDRFMHLTNYSINRYNSEYRTNNDSGACTGHKWSLKALWTYLKKRDVDVAEIMERIKDLIIKTIISADAYVNVLTKANVRRKFCVHELFGFDVILDEQCKPYIVEVNISPSLHSNSPLDISVKGAMICDLLNLSGFMIPDRRDILYDGSARRKPKLPKSLIFDRRVLPQALSNDEKLKHQYFTQRYHDEQARRNILDILTPDDLRILVETEDEFARRGSFERIFPTYQTRKYLKYFETPRYYNLLLNEWIAKYHRMEERGIALLNTYCKKNIHLQHPATDPTHMWAQYQKLQGHLSYRENDNNNGNGS